MRILQAHIAPSGGIVHQSPLNHNRTAFQLVLDAIQAAKPPSCFYPKQAYRDLVVFAHGRDYKAAMGDYVRTAGRIPIPPRAVFGSFYSRYWAYSYVPKRGANLLTLLTGLPSV